MGIFRQKVGRSSSPKLFKALGKLLGKKIEYTPVGLARDEFEGAMAKARKAHWRGANVTIPFKIDAAQAASRLTAEAKSIGAVNVLRFDADKSVGHNTDAEGLRDALKFAGVVMGGITVLVFGAGGAARAAGYALAKSGAKRIHFTNRTDSTAKRLVRDLAPSFPGTSFSSGKPRNAQLWINATPLGQEGHPDVSPAPKALRPPMTAVDLVYGKKTAFQRHAERMGARTMDGMPMLVFQALRAYEFWDKPFGPRKKALLAEALMKELS